MKKKEKIDYRQNFSKLERIEELNENFENSVYPSIEVRDDAEKLSQEVKVNIRKLKNRLSNNSLFINNFELRLNKVTNGRSPMYRDWTWIDSLPSKFKDFINIKTFRDYPQLQLCGFNSIHFTSSSIWLEPSSYKYRGKFIELLQLLKQEKTDNLRIYLEINDVKKPYNKLINDNNLNYVIKNLSQNIDKKSNIKCSIRFIYPRESITENFDFERTVVRDTKILLNYFFFLFDFEFTQSSPLNYFDDGALLSTVEKKKKKKLRSHFRFERSTGFVNDYKRKYSHIKNCPACKINPHETYKLINERTFFELHHINPLSNYKNENAEIAIDENDVILLCPNCHRAFHRIMSEYDLEKIDIKTFNKKYLKNKFTK
ncbi:MAG: HNH endonuclease [Bacteroidetes bacterium]|nr:HNH endonuclease [Bacteroidota bacterium]